MHMSWNIIVRFLECYIYHNQSIGVCHFIISLNLWVRRLMHHYIYLVLFNFVLLNSKFPRTFIRHESRSCFSLLIIVWHEWISSVITWKLKVVWNPQKAPSIKLVFWHLPLPGWLKVNTDGAASGSPRIPSYGGIFRNYWGLLRVVSPIIWNMVSLMRLRFIIYGYDSWDGLGSLLEEVLDWS